MKKDFATLLMLCMALSLLAGCGSADSGVMDAANANAVSGGNSDLPVVTWKMGSTWGAGNVHFTVDQRFTELVSQLTGPFQDHQLCRRRAVLRQPAVRLCQPGHHRVRRRLGRLLVR